MRVAIIITTLNSEHWIRGCLDSIQSSTYIDKITIVGDIRFVLKACVPKLSSKDKRELRRLRLKRLARLVQNRAIQDAANSNSSRAWKEFARALSIDPMSAFERSTWGSMRRLLRQGGAGV
jgi:hypothetical protein